MATRRRADNPEKLARALRERKDALEQQAATAAILKVIRRSPGDAQPVFDAIVRSALRLVGGHSAIALRLVDGLLHLVAHSSTSTAGDDALKRYYPQPVKAVYLHGRAIRSRRPYSAADTERVPASMASVKSMARKRGYRSLVVVPMLRDGEPIGSIGVSRKQPGEFSKSQIRTLEAFAEEAVIAIENARLFNETKEALAQQTAAGEILRVMASSPSDVQPVFDAIARNSSRLCNGNYAIVTRFDGELIHLAAQHNPRPNAAELTAQRFPRRPGRDLPSSRAVLEGALVHIPYADEDPDLSKEHFRRIGAKSFLSVPMLKDGVPVGSISVSRAERGPFPPTQIELMKLFADQAVMAIENVRLFNETKEALERQTATSEVLRVISRTPADAQPVFEAIAQSAVRLFDAPHAGVVLVEGESLRLKATSGKVDPRGQTLIPFDRTSTVGRALLDKEIVDVPDIEAPGAPAFARSSGRVVGFRAVASAPMLRDGNGIGAIMVQRARPGALTAKQRELLQTFADQAVIAIENARLFNETKSALARQTATADILRVLGRSITDVQPVFDAIVKNCSDLFEDSGIILRTVSGDELVSRASIGYDAAPVPIDRSSAVGACVLEGRTIHFPDIEQAAKEFPRVRQLGLKYGFRSGIYAPLKRADKAIGAICVLRRALGAFDEKEVELLTTFADQAVIAIENVRLFNETKEALEHQQASADILRIVSQSVADSQPAFEAILAAVRRLFDGFDATVWRLETDRLVAVARGGPTLPSTAGHSVPATPDHVYGIAIRERRPVQIDDVARSHEINELSRQDLLSRNRRAVLLVPFVRDGDCVGAISVSRSEPHGFSEKQVALLKNFAAQAVIAIENARLFNETKEALEQQTATAEILRVISSSPTETQPVFEAIVQSAVRLFAPCRAVIVMRDGDLLQRKAAEGALANIWPLPFDPERSMAARCIIERRIIEIPDTEAPGLLPVVKTLGRAAGYRAVTVVPLLREGEGVGVIGLHRPEPGFKLTEKQLALVQTFADQAVIAIENVRLFNETKEALERQTAISEILRVISGSPADIKPVLDTVAAHAARICHAQIVDIALAEGPLLRIVASVGDAGHVLGQELPLDRSTGSGRSIVDRAPVHVVDMQQAGNEFPLGSELARKYGIRTILGVPLLREGRALGSIMARRGEVRRFEDKDVALLKTFADQAAIAIENARLFNETKEALERQTATAEILKVISASPTDVQPVFDAIAERAAVLCGAKIGVVTKFDGELLHLVAFYGASPDLVEPIRAGYPVRPGGDTVTARAVRDCAPAQIPDLLADPDYVPKQQSLRAGYRSNVAVPLLREGKVIGALSVARAETGVFSEREVGLLQTFADQAVIAIENTRLFNELEARTQALTKSVRQLTALGEVGQAIGSTLELETVLKTIVTHAVKLSGVHAGIIYEYDETRNAFDLRASEGFAEESLAGLREAPIRVGVGAVGRAVATRTPTAVPDTHAPDYPRRFRQLLDRQGFRAVLAVPLTREERTIGALMVVRKSPGAFAPEIVELLGTLATQSALAIQNAHLYREIEQKSRELETASRHKSQFLASMSHELRTPLNAILGFNEMILDQVYGEVPPDVQEPLQNIQSSGKHLLGLINNVLDLAKIEAGRMELALSDYSVQDTVASVHSTLKPLAAEKGLDFVAEVPADIPPAHGDPGRVAQCLMNLAGNSLKFTKQGRVAIAVARSDGLLRFSVADTGIGIPADKIASLFTEFKQTDATIASEYGGTGLGLSITKKFIEMHGGKIWVESEPGKGSTFLFEIPLRAAQ